MEYKTTDSLEDGLTYFTEQNLSETTGNLITLSSILFFQPMAVPCYVGPDFKSKSSACSNISEEVVWKL